MIGVSVAKRKNTRPSDADVGDMIVTTDYMTAGNLIGEFGLLTRSTRTSSCTCESSVQVRTIAPCKRAFREVLFTRTTYNHYLQPHTSLTSHFFPDILPS